jgi:hypothetical protein
MVTKKVQYRHSRAIAVEISDDPIADTPFAEGKGDGLDPNLRHRLISERAYARYCERGYADGYDMDDWLEAEAEADHTVLHPADAA